MPSFAQISGFQLLKESFRTSVAQNKVAQTQLFIGQDGGAGLAIALSLSKYLVCEQPNEDSCGTCLSCKQFESGNYPDLYFSFPFAKLPSLSSNPICDELLPHFRELISHNSYPTLKSWQDGLDSGNKQLIIPVSEAQSILRKTSITTHGKRPRIFIIWLPEFMHTSAANKLLKTLEEPGANTYFFLVTHAPGRILDTILSRCVRITVPLHSQEQIETELIDRGVAKEDAIALSIISDGRLGYALYNQNDQSLRSRYADLFVQWVRAIYARNVSELIAFSDSFGALNREDSKSFIRFCSSVMRQGFLLNNSQIITAFAHNGFRLDKFIPFMDTTKMNEMERELESVRTAISRNANSRLLIFDTSLRFFKYIG
jgi:DNA polymerase-3 subunit delta'